MTAQPNIVLVHGAWTEAPVGGTGLIGSTVVARPAEHGHEAILVPRDGAGPFRETDVQKVRLAAGCEQAGLPMAGIASAIQAGRLSFAFLEAAPFRRWAVRSGRTYRQVSEETGVPLDTLGRCWSRWGSPGRALMSRCGRTSWRWCRCCSWACPAGPSTWPG
jgi:hypothetical protein